MLDDPFKYGLLVALAIALLFAAFTDLRSRRIDNWLNAGIALGAPLFWWANGIALWPDLAIQIGVAAGVLVLLVGMWALRWMGGGDVKLLGALALWIAPWAYLKLIVVMALIGGVLTVVVAAWYTMRRQRDKMVVPYGVAIALAGLWTLSTTYMPAASATGTLG